VDGAKNPYTIVLEHGIITAFISLDGQGRVAGLQFTEIIDSRGSLADAVKEITSLDGESSVLIRKNGEILIDIQVDSPLAVGSSFKLGILAALQDAVADGLVRGTSVHFALH
jgi:beta-lactamase class A